MLRNQYLNMGELEKFERLFIIAQYAYESTVLVYLKYLFEIVKLRKK